MVFIVFALCFSKFKVDQARLAPESQELKEHMWESMSAHLCCIIMSIIFSVFCVLRKNPNKPTPVECGLLSLSSQDQSQIHVVLPFLCQRPFSQELVAQQTKLF